MGGLEVVAVDSKGASKEFIELPYRLYRNEPHWVPPLRIAVKELLDKSKHPFYADAETELFLARRDGQVVGRIAGIINRAHDRFHQEKAGFFGFFDCVNEAAVAEALLSRARQVDPGARRDVSARPGEPLHQLRVRDAGGRLRRGPDGDDGL